MLEPMVLEHLVPDPLRVVARLELAPTRRTRRTAAAAIVGTRAWSPAVIAPAVEMVALAAPALPPIPGVRSPATFVIVTAAVVAPLSVHLVTVDAVAPSAAPLITRATSHCKVRDVGCNRQISATGNSMSGVKLGKRTRMIPLDVRPWEERLRDVGKARNIPDKNSE